MSNLISDKFKSMKAEADALVQVFLKADELLKEGLRELHDVVGRFGIKAIQADIPANGVWITYEVYRNDPLFDDYTSEKFLPLAYLESSDPARWLKRKRQEMKLEREEKQRQERQKKIQNLRFQIAAQERELDSLMGEQ